MGLTTRIVVISGLLPHDSGKTWFTLGLLEALRHLGLNATVYKPVAAHNLWFSPRTLVKSIEFKLLVGNDVLAYYERGVIRDIAKSNPVALGLAPRDLFATSSLDEYLESFEEFTKMLVITRFTDCASGIVRHFVISENLEKTPLLVRSRIEELAEVLSSVKSTVREVLNYLRSEELTVNLEKCLEELSSNMDIVVVESFNDAVVPFTSLLDKLSTLIVVTPGYVLLYTERELVKNTVIKSISALGDEGYRAKYLVEGLKPTRVLSSELQVEPSASRVHVETARILASPETI